MSEVRVSEAVGAVAEAIKTRCCSFSDGDGTCGYGWADRQYLKVADEILQEADSAIRKAIREELKGELLGTPARDAAQDAAEDASVYSELDDEYVRLMSDAALSAALSTLEEADDA